MNAGRIVFRADDEYLFAEPTGQAVLDVIQRSNPSRYKLQELNERRWTNLTKYKPVGSGSLAFEAIQRGDINTAKAVPPSDIARAAELTPKLFHHSLKTVLKEMTTGSDNWRKTARIKAMRTILDDISVIIDDTKLSYARAAIDLFLSTSQLQFDQPPEYRAVEQTLTDVHNRVEIDPSRYSTCEGQIALSLTLGKLLSLIDRNQASSHFSKVRRLDDIGLIEYFYSDMGAMTYYSETTLDEEDSRRARKLRESIVNIRDSSNDGDVGVLISVDQHFFRIYAPIIFYYAQQMPKIDYNILICGDMHQGGNLISAADEYMRSLSEMNRSGIPRNVNYFRAPIPEFVAEDKTFFASARFFAAQTMLERYPNVYAMDADLLTDVDPQPYFAEIRTVAFGVPETRGFNYLSPWRRNMAGNMALNRNVLDTSMLEDLQVYLAHGLTSPMSWMLDQNAIAYAVEKNEGAYADLAKYRRPFRQPKFRASWEKNYWSSIED